MQPSSSSSSSSAHPPDHHDAKPSGPAMGYPVPIGNPAAAAVANGSAPAAFGIAYPYPAPPHHPPPHHHYPYPPPPPHHHHHYAAHPPPPPSCLRHLLAAIVGAFLFLGAATFIVWLLLRPRAPAFAVTSLALSRVAYSPANSSLSASFDAAFLAANPNSKLSVAYFSPLASVFLAPSSPLAVASLAPFGQGPGNATTLAFRLVVEDAYVGPDAAAALKTGAVDVQVRLMAVAVFDRGGWRTSRRVMRVMCDGVKVVFRGKNSTEAAFHGPPRRCDVFL
ncbi:hypothetical protein Zm00014a_042357 [Zea mays]|uniref:Late embryogenesis abundant (LEA) hydroxyproline-rich glycoprotein family n=2 Tax=Zea mays TaxID=4577 RepID=B4FXQ2_MAIZE|nr:uncharacterized protein LOC100273836 [Zea mays]ACF86895.1 unknown [Zea mays]ONM19733.1 Late embryogenesis abundant (LEA) hydroxyproline-rich glycoprotein family [Zea mays]PWZ36659.1 hypothetical protein Zm00014a_042357 [Zea mays]|eukprot:NP_001141707.1 uncharacterized protein LOC100273836 [Zea mays]